MTPSSPKPTRESQSRPAEPPAGPKQPSPPWRTEGLPPGQPPKRRPRWLSMVLWGGRIAGAVHDAHDAGAAVGTGCRAVHGVQAPGPRPERRRGVRARRIDRRRAQEGRAAPRPPGQELPAIHHRTSDVLEGRSARRADHQRDDRAREAAGAAARLPDEHSRVARAVGPAVRVLELDAAAPAGRDGRDPRRRKAAAGRS